MYLKTSANTAMTDNNSCYSLGNAVDGVYSNSACTTKVKVGTLTTGTNGVSNPISVNVGTYYRSTIWSRSWKEDIQNVCVDPGRRGRASDSERKSRTSAVWMKPLRAKRTDQNIGEWFDVNTPALWKRQKFHRAGVNLVKNSLQIQRGCEKPGSIFMKKFRLRRSEFPGRFPGDIHYDVYLRKQSRKDYAIRWRLLPGALQMEWLQNWQWQVWSQDRCSASRLRSQWQ